MSFTFLVKDDAIIQKSNGEEIEVKVRNSGGNKFFIISEYPVKKNDIILYTDSRGILIKYKIIDEGFKEKTVGIPSHYQAEVERIY